MGADLRIEVVRGGLDEERAGLLLSFWSSHGVLSGDDAVRRLPDVVCLLVDDAGAVMGSSSVYEDDVPLIGNRRFWVYRRFLAPQVPDEMEARMLVATFDALQAERSDPEAQPVGLCYLVDDPAIMRRHPEAVWPESEMLYAGYLPDGRQARIRYFEGALIA